MLLTTCKFFSCTVLKETIYMIKHETLGFESLSMSLFTCTCALQGVFSVPGFSSEQNPKLQAGHCFDFWGMNFGLDYTEPRTLCFGNTPKNHPNLFHRAKCELGARGRVVLGSSRVPGKAVFKCIFSACFGDLVCSC